MCDRPILIDNPYRGLARIGPNKFHDCTSLKLSVPCGNCPTCISLRQSYFVQRTQMESLNRHLFMVTLTYRQSMIRSIKLNGYTLYYPDWSDVQNMFKRLRKRGYKDFRYFAVSEYGKKHRPHFHMILSLPKKDTDTLYDIMNLEYKWQDLIIGEWRRNYGSTRKPLYKDLCSLIFTTKGRTYDFHYINPSLSTEAEADVAFYVTKYLLKSNSWLDRLKSALKLNLSPEKFQEVWKLLKPKCCCSHYYGLGKPISDDIRKHIRKGIDLSIKSESLFPYYINPINGKTFPLSPYYQKLFFTVNDKEYFYLKEDDDRLDSVNNDSLDINYFQSKVKDSKFEKIKRSVEQSHCDSYDLEDFNFSTEALEEISSVSDPVDFLPDDWQNDFND